MSALYSRVMAKPMTPLPTDHPQRRALADEVHARPPAIVESPAVVSMLALMDAPAEGVLAAVTDLARLLGVAAISPPQAAHFVVELPGLRIKWERHGEFCSLTLVAPLIVVLRPRDARIRFGTTPSRQVVGEPPARLQHRTCAALLEDPR
jgi:uncharacterized membrane-anchored protein